MIVDLFSGANGWGEGLKLLGHRNTLGVELNPTAALTAVANGHPTLVASVSDLNARVFQGRVSGLVASPPCQGFSQAGKGKGREDVPHVLGALEWVALGASIDETITALRSRCSDERTALVLEPLRWVLDLAPEWTAWEQVPAVLPLWERCAEILRAAGYFVWTGLVQAERYGVPQTRKRAVLIASRTRQVGEPVATHSRYYSTDPTRLDEGVLPWVSIGEALGRIGGDEFVGGPMMKATRRRLDHPAPTVHSSRAGNLMWALRSNYGTGGDPAARGERSLDEPAATVTSKIDRNKWVLRGSNQAHAARRPLDAPASTLHFAERCNKVEFISEETAADPRASGRRVTVEEAAVLQSFPADYRWHGKSGAKYLQVGNAVPPLLSRAVCAEAMGASLRLVDAGEQAAS